MKINRKLIEKMITRIETMPETYAQQVFIASADSLPRDAEKNDILPRPKPACGTVACLAGEAIICSHRSVKKGIEELTKLSQEANEPQGSAAERMGIPHELRWSLFDEDSRGWPEPFRSQFEEADDYIGEAQAAVNLLKAILETDGKVLER